VLKAGGSDISKVVKVNVFLTSMDNFAEMNATVRRPSARFPLSPFPILACYGIVSKKRAPPASFANPVLLWQYEKFFTHKPARSCVAVYQLPKGVPVEIECIALA